MPAPLQPTTADGQRGRSGARFEFVPAPARLLATAERWAERPAYFVRDDTRWQPTSWRDHAAQVQRAGRALVALDVRPRDVVCILGFNRPEWVVMDLAAMLVGAVAAGIYWTSSPEEVAYIVAHSGCAVLLVEDEAQWARVGQQPALQPPQLRVVMMDGNEPQDGRRLSWRSFLALGDATSLQPHVEQRLAAIRPDDPGTLIYTSGTTGPAKAVVLSHGNLSWTAQALCASFDVGPDDRLISYLPLAHIAEQMGAIHDALQAGYAIYFARSMEQLGEHLKEVRPTLFFGVPRVWEKMQTAIGAKLAGATGARAALARWALHVGRHWHARQLEGRPVGWVLQAQKRVAGALVHDKIKRALGFDAARLLISGAAPIAPESLRFFTGLDLVLREVYGQSEDCGPTTINLPGTTRLGSVGKPLPGVEVAVAADGEILVRGPHVFLGYLGGEDSTAQALQDGWLHSGDLGRRDDDGYLYITGRKKDLIITSGGKNISPGNLEAELMQLPLVEHAVVCGDGRHYVAALLTLDAPALSAFAQARGLPGAAAQWRHCDQVRVALQAGIDDVNSRQARVAQVRRFHVLDEPMSIETGELTATMKIRRNLVLQRHASVVARLYDEPPP